MTYLLILRQWRHEINQRFVILFKANNGIGVGGMNSGAGEVEARDLAAIGLEKPPESEPAPGSMADAVNQNKVTQWRRLCHFEEISF